MRTKLPQAISVVLLTTGCPGPTPADGGTADGGGDTCQMSGDTCDAGAGNPTGYCVTFSTADGGPELRCILV